MTLYRTSWTGIHHPDVVPDTMEWEPSPGHCTGHHGLGIIIQMLSWSSWTGNHPVSTPHSSPGWTLLIGRFKPARSVCLAIESPHHVYEMLSRIRHMLLCFLEDAFNTSLCSTTCITNFIFQDSIYRKSKKIGYQYLVIRHPLSS